MPAAIPAALPGFRRALAVPWWCNGVRWAAGDCGRACATAVAGTGRSTPPSQRRCRSAGRRRYRLCRCSGIAGHRLAWRAGCGSRCGVSRHVRGNAWSWPTRPGWLGRCCGLDAIAAGLSRLHTCLPSGVLAAVPPVSWPAEGMMTRMRSLTSRPAPHDDPGVQVACRAAKRWIDWANDLFEDKWRRRRESNPCTGLCRLPSGLSRIRATSPTLSALHPLNARSSRLDS
jgi:hypothetical protein